MGQEGTWLSPCSLRGERAAQAQDCRVGCQQLWGGPGSEVFRAKGLAKSSGKECRERRRPGRTLGPFS